MTKQIKIGDASIREIVECLRNYVITENPINKKQIVVDFGLQDLIKNICDSFLKFEKIRIVSKDHREALENNIDIGFEIDGKNSDINLSRANVITLLIFLREKVESLCDDLVGIVGDEFEIDQLNDNIKI